MVKKETGHKKRKKERKQHRKIERKKGDRKKETYKGGEKRKPVRQISSLREREEERIERK